MRRLAAYFRKLPKVNFHALRHSHASALIAPAWMWWRCPAALGHASPALTLNFYTHLFHTADDKAAAAIDAALS